MPQVQWFAIGDVLYHSTHGLCRVSEVIKGTGKERENISYALLPSHLNPMKLRYVIPENSIISSGFHSLVSLAEAQEILEYFRKGHAATPTGAIPGQPADPGLNEQNTWALAECLLKSSQDDAYAIAKRKNQVLSKAARGLIVELSIVLKISPREVVERVQSCLQRTSRLSPVVVSALQSAIDDSGMPI